MDIVAGAGHELDRLVLRSLRTTDRSVHTVADPLRLALSVPQAASIMARWRPQVVLTTGGYLAIPVLMAAAGVRVPSLLWEGNAIPGRSSRATARLASLVCVSFAQTCAALPGRCFVTGTPIRPLWGIDRDEARGRLRLPAGIPVLLVFGGSQAVRRLNDAVADALPGLVDRCAVLHLTGQAGYADALRQREALPEVSRARYRPEPFLREEMADALVAADLLVGRAGSSTLAEATAVGLPLVVVPYPWAAGHQLANARHLVEAGAALLIADDDLDGPALLAASRILDHPARYARMAQASREQGRPGAASAVASLLVALAARQGLPRATDIDRLARSAS